MELEHKRSNFLNSDRNRSIYQIRFKNNSYLSLNSNNSTDHFSYLYIIKY